MKALVTGANGHLGSHLCRVLIADGIDVRAMVRRSSCLDGLNGLSLELVYGDVLDRDSVLAAVKGCNVVFHLGCPTSLEPGISETISKGTQNVLTACATAEVDRLIFTSSIVTVGYSPSPNVILDEKSIELNTASEYHSGKWQAERLVLEFAKQTGLNVVVTNPATIIGALDYRVTPSNAPIQQCLDKGLPFSFDSGLTIVHAEDVALGHLLALKHGKSGERYILGGNRVTISEYFCEISHLCGRRLPILELPKLALLFAGACFSILNSTRIKVPFTYRQAKVLAGRYGWYSSEKAVKELGYSWRPLREAIASYIDWKRSHRFELQSERPNGASYVK